MTVMLFFSAVSNIYICHARELDFKDLITNGTGQLFREPVIPEELPKKGLTAPGYMPPLYPINRARPKLFPERQEYETEGPTRLRLTADEIHHKGDVTTATGNVRIIYRDMEMQADNISYHHSEKIVKAAGDVFIQHEKNQIHGTTLTLEIETNKASLSNPRGVLTDTTLGDEELQGEFFFWGDKVILDKNITIINGDLSSCDNPRAERHYHITGEEIIIIPREKMIIRKGRFFYNNKQLLGLNSLVIPLRPQRRNQIFLIPRIGHNQLDGFYVKESVGYEWGKRDYGTVSLDWFDRAGLAGGVEHYYHLGDRGAGRFNYYTMGSPRSGSNRYDLSNRVYYRFPGNYFVSANYTANRYEYPGYSSPNIKNADLFVSHNTAWSSSALYIRDYWLGTDRNYGFNFAHRFEINPRLSTGLVLDYLSSQSDDHRRYRLNTLARIQQKGDLFDTWLILDHTHGDSNFYANRLPEVSLRGHPFKLGPLNSRVAFSAGSFREMPSGVSALRSDIKFTAFNEVIPLGKSTDMALAAGARQFIYGSGEKKYLVRTRWAMEERLGDHFKVILSHHFQDRDGHSPLAMDYFDKYHLSGATLELYNKEHFRFQVTGAYDFNNRIYQSIIPRLELSPDKRTVFLFGSNYDYNNRTWMNIDGQIGYRITDSVTIKYWGLYDLINRKMNYQNYVLEIDSHDFATRFVYRGSQGELWFNVALKGFPTDTVEVGADPERKIIPKDILEGAPDEERL